MFRVRQLVVFSFVLLTAVMLAGSAEAADQKEVKLTLNVNSSGASTITVDPENTQIWRNKPNKPKKIYWKTVNNSSHAQLFWELRYDPEKGGGTANYFGDVDLECGTTSIKVQPDKKPDFPFAQWPYSVTVYSCVDGSKGQKLAEVDPRIVWKD